MKDLLEKSFQNEGLIYLGTVKLGPEPDFGRFERWLGDKLHAGMGFLEQNQSLRMDPRELLPSAGFAVIFGMSYFLGDTLRTPTGPRIAQYARWRDYHKSMRQRAGKAWESFLQEAAVESKPESRICVDSAPVLERALAARTEAGFIGKNTLYIHPRKGSFLLLGEVLTSLSLPMDVPTPVDPTQRASAGGCGTCKRCQVHCPTGALNQDYRLDANLCLSYWSIEHRGTIPEQFWPHFAKYWFGCDLCQLACPYNRNAHVEVASLVRDLCLFDVATMDEKFYVDTFGGTPLTRAKRHGLRRNALIAMTVTSDPRLPEALEHVTADDPSMLCETRDQILHFIKNSRS